MEYCFGPEWLWWCWMRWYEISNPFSRNKNVSYSEVSKMFLEYLFLRLPLLTIALANYLQFNASHTLCLSDLRNCTLCQGIGRAGISPSLCFLPLAKMLCQRCVTWWLLGKDKMFGTRKWTYLKLQLIPSAEELSIPSYMVFSFIVWMPYILSYSVFFNNGCSFITAISFFSTMSDEQQPQKFHFSCT